MPTHSSGYCSNGNGADLKAQGQTLFTLTTEVIKSNPNYLETNLQKLIGTDLQSSFSFDSGDFRRKFGYNLVIVVDEAHTLIDRCQYFHGPTQTSVRGLLTKMITTYTYFPEVSLVVAGTG